MGYRLGNDMTSETQIDRTVNFIQKDKDFHPNLLINFESICERVVEKFDDKHTKKTYFSKSIGAKEICLKNLKRRCIRE
jgi:hypothetical protein